MSARPRAPGPRCPARARQVSRCGSPVCAAPGRRTTCRRRRGVTTDTSPSRATETTRRSRRPVAPAASRRGDLGDLHREGQPGPAAQQVEVEVPGRGAGRASAGRVLGRDPAVVQAVGQHQQVGGEPVAADVRDLPGAARGATRSAPRRSAGPARRSRRRAGRACRRRTPARRSAARPGRLAPAERRRGRGRAAPRAPASVAVSIHGSCGSA